MDNTLWNSLHPLSSIDTIVHLGAGKCSWIDTYLKSSAKTIVLVEPEPTAAKYLRSIAKEESRIQVIEKAVALEGERTTLKVYNLRDASSLREPTGLRDLYPGIRKTNEVDVDVIRPADLVKGIAGKLWFIIDVPGEELSILKSLEQERLLSECSLLSVSCGEIELYNESGTYKVLCEYLDDNLFENLYTDEEENPDRLMWVGASNFQARETARLKEKLSKVQEEIRISNNREAELKDQFLVLKKEILILQENLSNNEKELTNNQKEIENLHEEKKQIEKHFSNYENKLNLEIMTTKDELNASKKLVNSQLQVILNLEKNIDYTKNLCASLENELKTEIVEKNVLKKEYGDIVSELTKEKSRISNLGLEIEECKIENIELKERNSQLKLEIAFIEGKVKLIQETFIRN